MCVCGQVVRSHTKVARFERPNRCRLLATFRGNQPFIYLLNLCRLSIVGQGFLCVIFVEFRLRYLCDNMVIKKFVFKNILYLIGDLYIKMYGFNDFKVN